MQRHCLWVTAQVTVQQATERVMDKDRIKGMGKQVKGSVKEAAGKLTGDAKLQAEGRAEKVAGKIQNAVGGAKDAVRENKDLHQR
jgi:uncharacterized protein YjbJ (UPF0337 family)